MELSKTNEACISRLRSVCLSGIAPQRDYDRRIALNSTPFDSLGAGLILSRTLLRSLFDWTIFRDRAEILRFYQSFSPLRN
jgi:hypothetical protein